MTHSRLVQDETADRRRLMESRAFDAYIAAAMDRENTLRMYRGMTHPAALEAIARAESNWRGAFQEYRRASDPARDPIPWRLAS